MGRAVGRGVVLQGAGLATSLMKKMNGDGDWLLFIMLFEVFYYGIEGVGRENEGAGIALYGLDMG